MQHRRWLILLGFSLTATSTGCQSTNWSTAEKGNAPRSKSASVASTAPKTAPSSGKSKFARKTVDELMADGARLERAEQRTEAVAVYSLVVEREPDHAEAHHRLGILSDLKGDYVAAEKHYRVALSQKPNNPDLLSDLGYSYSLRGNHREAEEILRQALANDPGHVQAINNLAQVYGEQGRFEEAVATLRKVRSEAEARQSLAELFPGKFPAGGGGGSTDWTNSAVASRDASPPASASAQTPTADDLSKMSIDQIRALMEQQRQDALRDRRLRDEQVLARQEMLARQAQAVDWAGNPAGPPANTAYSSTVQQTAGMPLGNSAAPGAGPFGNSPSTVPPNGLGAPANPAPADVVPGAELPFFQGKTNSAAVAATPRPEAAPLPVIQPADFGKPPSWAGPAAQAAQQPMNVPANHAATAPPAGPALPSWANAAPPANTSMPIPAGPQPTPSVASNQSMPADMPLASTQTVSVPMASMQYRAAQLGLQIGPGVLFPTVSSTSGATPASTPNRFGTEFPNTPTYSPPVDPAFGSMGSPPSAGPSLPPANANSTTSTRVAPSSPSANWASPWDRTTSGVQTAGGFGSAGNSSAEGVAPAGAWSTDTAPATATGDPFRTSPSMNSNAPRQQMSTAPWPPGRATNGAPTTVNKPAVNPNEPPLWPHAPR